LFALLLDPSGANCDASDDSSGDEASPDKSSSHASFHSEKDDRDVIKAEAKKERKRLKREEKEKRREERRLKKKMMRTQEMEVDIVEDPDIEEDEDCCVVRIAPKPIKIKIKPITKPQDETVAPAGDFAAVNEEVNLEQKSEPEPSNAPPNHHVNNRPVGPPSPVTHMHPKKKIAHMDSLVNNYPIVNNLIHSTLNTFPTLNLTNKPSESTNSSSASSLSSSVSTTPTQNMIPTKSSATPPLITTINLKTGTSPIPQPDRNGVTDRQYSTDVEILDNEDPSSSPNPQDCSSEQHTPPLSTRERPKRTPNGENSARRGRDARTKCDVCQGEGNNANLVRCDECLRCYHFGCLNPPVKKTPKVSGWAWSCSECVPSDEDKGWHL